MAWAGMDAEDLRRLWMDGWTACEIARRVGCLESTIYALRQRYDWPDPEGSSNEPPPPSTEDARLSEDSLALSPWVQARADEIRAQRVEKLEAEPWDVTRTRLAKVGQRAFV
jgi:transposase